MTRPDMPTTRSSTFVFENWNRYYDPFTGRSLQPEPYLLEPAAIEIMASGGHSLATYSYALNNPIRFVDPDGNLTVRLCPTRLTPASGTTAVVNAVDPSINKLGKSKLTAGITVSCSKSGYLTINLSLSCWVRMKYGTNDPRYGAASSPERQRVGALVTYEEARNHEGGHVSRGNQFISDWAGRHAMDEGQYCPEDCIKKANQLEAQFRAEWAQFDAAEANR